MKLLITLELTLLILATTFQSDNPPGWYQQELPVADYINDIFFLDSLNGWLITDSFGGNDSGYVLRTSDGGNTWSILFYAFIKFKSLQFVDSNIGYIGGGDGFARVLKTTDGGNSWSIFTFPTTIIDDIFFVNKDTGWVCADDVFDGGLWKTTNGGQNWIKQLDQTYDPAKLFFINKDTGWFGKFPEDELYKTTNGGNNWHLQYTFQPSTFKDILFINEDSGWISLGSNEVQFSSNGGDNWIIQYLPPKGGLILTSRSQKLSTINGKTIWTVGGNLFFGMGRVRGIVYKSTNSGNNWYYQIPDTAINISSYNNIQFINDTIGWAAYYAIIHTTDGGGPLVSLSSSNTEIPKDFFLAQNYPNPFNPKTVISYELRVASSVKLKVFNVQGKEIRTLINQRQNAGKYSVDFDGSELATGFYFYRLELFSEKGREIVTETKTMVLVR